MDYNISGKAIPFIEIKDGVNSNNEPIHKFEINYEAINVLNKIKDKYVF